MGAWQHLGGQGVARTEDSLFVVVVVVGLSRQSFFCVALAVLGELRILHLHLKAASGRLASSQLG